MSKSNMLLGLAKGKVGDLVFYRDGGEQRTRTRVVPKNPRTIAQMSQRVKIANVSGIFRAAASVLRDSFVNRPTNQSGFNAFASGAISLAPYLTAEQAKAGICVPQPAMVSKGTLPALNYRSVEAEDIYTQGLAIKGADSVPATIGGYSSVIMNNYPSVVVGDEITFVTLKFQRADGVALDVAMAAATPIIGSFKVDPSDSRNLEDLGYVYTDDAIAYTGNNVIDDASIVMQFVIHSHVSADGKLDVSTQYAHLSDNAQTIYDNYRTSQALNAAVESYKASATALLR